MWFLYFILGIFLAYLVTSKRIRSAILHRNGTKQLEMRIREEEAVKPSKGVPIEDEDEVKEWLNKNPDLKRVNR